MVDRRGLLLACLTVSMLGLAGCPTIPSTHNVCLSCEIGVQAADAAPENLTVTASELRIQVNRDGTARWRVRSHLNGSGVTLLKSNETRLQWLAEQAVTDEIFYEDDDRNRSRNGQSIHSGNVRDLTTRLENDTLALSFTVDDVADRGFGNTLVVDYFHHESEEYREYRLGTDRVLLTASPESFVTEPPSTGRVTNDASSVEWRGNQTTLQLNSYVVFAPSTDADFTTQIALAEQRAGWILPRALSYWMILLSVGVPGLLGLTHKLTGSFPVGTVGRGSSLGQRIVTPPPTGLLATFVISGPLIGGLLFDIRVLTDAVRTILLTVPVVPVAGLFVLGLTIDRHPRIERTMFVLLLLLPLLAIVALLVAPEGTPAHRPVLPSLAFASGLIAVFGAISFYVGAGLQDDTDDRVKDKS